MTRVLPIKHFHRRFLIFLFIALFKLAPSVAFWSLASLFLTLFLTFVVSLAPNQVLVFSNPWKSKTGRRSQKKTPVSKKLTATSKHSRGKLTLGGRPMRQRPSSLLSSTTGDMYPTMAIAPKPPQIINIPRSQIRSFLRGTKGARTTRARSRRKMYLRP